MKRSMCEDSSLCVTRADRKRTIRESIISDGDSADRVLERFASRTSPGEKNCFQVIRETRQINRDDRKKIKSEYYAMEK